MSAGTRWTGGQYSVFRFVFGVYLAVHFAHLLPWGAEVFSSAGVLASGELSPLLHAFPNVLILGDDPWMVTALIASAAAGSLLFAVGKWDRCAAVWIWYVTACLFGRNPLIANPSLPCVGWLLLAHAFMPPRPFGSLGARGRVDPDGGWRFPRGIFVAAWVVMALGYTYSGYTKLVSPSWVDGTAMQRVLENPLARPSFVRDAMLALPDGVLQAATWGGLGLELLFAPLALWRRARPWIWAAMLAMHLQLMVLIDFADLSLGMVMLHAFTFDPAWVRPRAADAPDLVLYDGACGLCHGFVRLALAEDTTGSACEFAPLHGETYDARLTAEQRAAIPDSLVVVSAGGEVFLRSDAVLRLLTSFGGGWRAAAMLARFVPRVIRDAVYDAIARVRRRVFASPPDACPVLPPHMRARFLA